MKAGTASGRAVGVVALATTMAFSALSIAKGKHRDKSAPAGKDQDKAAVSQTVEEKQEKPETVHISVQTVPPRKAMVRWGNKSLGMIPVPRPLVVERPRDSGPLDLVIRATGYLPVHTRVYTFSDSRVAVKLTLPTEKNKLFGYKQEPTPSPEAAPGGDATPGPVPPPAPLAPAQ